MFLRTDKAKFHSLDDERMLVSFNLLSALSLNTTSLTTPGLADSSLSTLAHAGLGTTCHTYISNNECHPSTAQSRPPDEISTKPVFLGRNPVHSYRGCVPTPHYSSHYPITSSSSARPRAKRTASAACDSCGFRCPSDKHFNMTRRTTKRWRKSTPSRTSTP